VIDIQQIINSSFGVNMLSNVARLIPAPLGHCLADFIADRIVEHPKSKMVEAVRANLWVVSGEKLDKQGLDRLLCETYHNSARTIFDLYHNILNPRAMERRTVFTETALYLTRRLEFEKRGLMVAGLHLSNFDLVMRILTSLGMRPLILTLPNPQGSQRVEYELRKKTGMNLVTPSVATLRQALKYLQKGGTVLTGIDRPIPAPKDRPHFFGRPSDLPMHYIFLAAKAHVPVIVMATIQQADGKNHILTSEPIEMETHPKAEIEMLINAEKVLGISENFIRQAPNQWSIPIPVWPEVLSLVPA
jgi:lauroyl/myristoyl acyltransferase